MFLPTVIVFKFHNKLEEKEILRRINNVYLYNNYNTQCVSKNSINIQPKYKIYNNYGIIYYACEQDKLNIDLYQEQDGKVVISQHLPLGISSIIENYDKNIKHCLFDFFNNIYEKKENLKYIHGPQVLYSIDDKEIKIITDGIGFGRLYEYKTDEGVFWSNRIGSSIIFAEKCPELNVNAMSVYQCLGQYLNNDTTFQDITTISDGTFINITDKKITYDKYDCYEHFFNKKNDDITIDNIINKMNNFFIELKTFSSSGYQLGISGGRDSRAILSFFANNEKLIPEDFKLFTASPPELEIELAEKCINSSNLKQYWTTIDREVDQKPNFNLITRGMNWMKLYDGDFYPGVLYNDINIDSLNLPINYIRLSGIAGAAGHPNNINKKDLENPKAKIERFAKGKIKPSIYPNKILKDEYIDHTIKVIDDVLKEAETYDLHELYKFDYWYLKQRFRRWSGGNWDVETVTPFLTPIFLKAGFNLSFEDKFNSQLHKDIIAKNYSKWNDIPFSIDVETKIKEKGDWNEIKKINKIASRKFIWETDKEDFYNIINSISNKMYNIDTIKEIYNNIDDKDIEFKTKYQTIGLNIIFLNLMENHQDYLKNFIDTCKKDAL